MPYSKTPAALMCIFVLLSTMAPTQPTNADFVRIERIKQLEGDSRSAMVAAVALVEEDIATREALPLCLAALRQEAPDLRAAAAHALLTIGLRVEEAGRVAATLLDHSDRSIQRRVAPALLRSQKLGTRASAVLIDALRDPDPRERLHAARSLANRSLPHLEIGLALAGAATDPDTAVGRAAVQGLTRMPQTGVPAAGLEAHLESADQDVVRRAAAALLVLDAGHARARTVLEAAILRDRDDWAASELVHAGSAALQFHLTVLCTRRSTSGQDHRWGNVLEAIKSNLKTLAHKAPFRVVTALVALLGNPDAAAGHTAALEVLGSVGPRARHAVSDIVHAALSSEHARMFRASWALGQIDAHAAARALVEKVDSAHPSTTAARALDILKMMDSDAKPAAQVLRTLWRTAKGDRRRRLALALADIDPEESLPVVSELLASEDVGTRCRGVDAVHRIGPHAGPILQAVLAALDKRMRGTVYPLINALGAMGPAARGAVPRLIRLANEDERQRGEVVEALGRIGGAEARNEIIRTLGSTRSALLRRTALDALGTIGNSDDVDRILTYVCDRRPSRSNNDDRLRSCALSALSRFRAHPGRIVPALIAFIRDYRPGGGLTQLATMRQAFDTLAVFGPEATGGVSLLLAHLEHRDESIRISAVKTLAAVGARTPAVLEALNRSARNDNGRIRRAARKTLLALEADR